MIVELLIMSLKGMNKRRMMRLDFEKKILRILLCTVCLMVGFAKKMKL